MAAATFHDAQLVRKKRAQKRWRVFSQTLDR